jgi:hypothetical protein
MPPESLQFFRLFYQNLKYETNKQLGIPVLVLGHDSLTNKTLSKLRVALEIFAMIHHRTAQMSHR